MGNNKERGMSKGAFERGLMLLGLVTLTSRQPGSEFVFTQADCDALDGRKLSLDIDTTKPELYVTVKLHEVKNVGN